MFDQMTTAVSRAQAGKLKLLAVTAPKRMALAPNLPNMMESGISNFQMSSWQAVYALRGMPKPIVQRLNAEIEKILKTLDVIAKLIDQLGMDIVGSSPEELATFMKSEITRWADLVKKSSATAG